MRACPIQNNKTKQTQRRQGEIRCWTCNGPHLRRNCPRTQQRFIPHRWNSFSSTGGKTENNYRYNSNNRRVTFGNSTQTIELRRNYNNRWNMAQQFPIREQPTTSTWNQIARKGFPSSPRPGGYKPVNSVIPEENCSDSSDTEETLDKIKRLTFEAPEQLTLN